MPKSRASIFGDEEVQAIDIAGFAPKEATDTKAPDAKQIREVAQAANFKSREPVATKSEPSKRAPRLHRTGRNMQLNLKASKETVDAFYAVSDKMGWVLGETLEHALKALQRELQTK